jgi:hypothetical protein
VVASPSLAAQAGDYVKMSNQETREVFARYTTCVVKARAKDAAEVVLSTIGNEQIIHNYPRVVTPDCLSAGQQLAMPGDFLRYGLAEALVRREFSAGLPPDIGRAAPLAHFQIDETDYQPKPGKKANARQLAEFAKRRQAALAFRALSQYGECVVRADPAGALRLVLSKSRPTEEGLAFAALRQPLSECIPVGQTVAFSRISLRGTIAMNLYRLAKAPRITAAPASK